MKPNMKEQNMKQRRKLKEINKHETHTQIKKKQEKSRRERPNTMKQITWKSK